MGARTETQSQHQLRRSPRKIKHSMVWAVYCGEVGRGDGDGGGTGRGREGKGVATGMQHVVWGNVWDGVGSAYVV